MIEDLLSSVEIALFERRADNLFEPVGPIPSWLPVTTNPVDLIEEFPQLEMHLSDWETEWKGESEIVDIADPAGGNRSLLAVATVLEGRRYLAVKLLPRVLNESQQRAANTGLRREQAEKDKREIERLNRELARATQAKSDFLA